MTVRDISTEQIMAACPEVIQKASIPLKKINKGYWGQKKPHHAGRTVAAFRKGTNYYNEETRIKAACVYAITGSAAKTGEIMGIKPTTIRQWKTQPWWPLVIDRIRNEKDDELDVKFTEIIDKTVQVINDRLENGDYVYDVRTGELNRKPMGGKETAVVASIFVDKRQLLRERKQVRREEASVLENLKKLANEFQKFSKAKEITGDAVRVETEEQDQTREEVVVA